MHRPSPSKMDFIAYLPGWIFLLAGMALIGLAVLVKPWIQCEQLRYQHTLIQAQVNNLERQQEGYQQFYDTLQSRDPVLLQRLAYHYLGLKPVGVAVLNGFADGPISSLSPGWADSDGSALHLTSGLEPSDTVESWLHRPLPDALPALPQVQTRLYRLTTGPQRFVVIGVGLMCVMAAFLSSERCGGDRAA